MRTEIKNIASPSHNNQIFPKISHAAIISQHPARTNISLLIYRQSFFSSIFSFAAFEAVLYPAIRNVPLPFRKTNPRTAKTAMIRKWMISSINILRIWEKAADATFSQNSIGAGGGDRTRTAFPPGDFKSPASASSATPTYIKSLSLLLLPVNSAEQLQSVRQSGIIK